MKCEPACCRATKQSEVHMEILEISYRPCMQYPKLTCHLD